MIPRLLSQLIRPNLRASATVTAQVTAHVNGGPFLPGDRLDVGLIWANESGLESGQVSLDLVCIETFWYTVKATGAAFVGNYPGHREENHKGAPYTAAGRPGRYRTSKELVHLSSQVDLVNPDPNQTHRRGTASFQLPAAAPPTILGKIACVEWELRAGLASPVSSDRIVGKIIILSNPEVSLGNTARPPNATSTLPPLAQNCVVSISMPDGPLKSGQVLHGVLKANVLSDFNVTKVHAELGCWERAGAKRSAKIHATAELQGGTILHAGQEYQWPFQLRLPERFLPSARFDETSVVWQVKGILGRRLWARLETTRRVRVVTSR